VDSGPVGPPVNWGAGQEVGQPLEGKPPEWATVVFALARGHSGDQAFSAGLGNRLQCDRSACSSSRLGALWTSSVSCSRLARGLRASRITFRPAVRAVNWKISGPTAPPMPPWRYIGYTISIRTTNWTGFRPTSGASPFLHWLSSWQLRGCVTTPVFHRSWADS
jgi:hypothetical protein